MRSKNTIVSLIGLVFITGSILIGCNTASNLTNLSSTDLSSALSMKMYDAPITLGSITVIKVTINYEKMMVHKSNDAADSWITTVSNAGKIDNLLSLSSNAPMELGIAMLSEGKYTQIRIDLATNHTIVWITNNITNTSILKLPDGSNSSIKITGAFTLTSNMTTEIGLDFDAQKSIKQPSAGSSSWQLIPVIKLDKVSQSQGIGTNK